MVRTHVSSVEIDRLGPNPNTCYRYLHAIRGISQSRRTFIGQHVDFQAVDVEVKRR